MLRPAYEEVKRVDPGVQFIGPGEDVPTNLCYLLQNANQYYDVVSFHKYPWDGVDGYQADLDSMKPCFDAYGQGKPIWLTEFGVRTSLVSYPGTQATGLASAIADIEARPWIRRAVIYRARGSGADDFALTDISGNGYSTPKPAYYQAITSTANTGRPRVTINQSFASMYFADNTGGPGYGDYVLIANPNTSATTARVTFVRPDGSGRTRDIPMAAQSRLTIDLQGEPTIGGEGGVSVAVQSLDPNVKLYADHSVYWGTSSAGGRATEGVAANTGWYFAEGAINNGSFPFHEYLTIFNPNPQPMDVAAKFLLSTGLTTTRTLHIYEGPGRVRIHVNDLIQEVTGEHGIQLTAPAPIVAERTIEWGPDRRDGSSTPGVPALSNTWYFAEGANGSWSTYILVSNPNAVASNVQVDFLSDTGVVQSVTGSVPAGGRTTFTAPGTLPIGGFATVVTSTNGVPVASERSQYWDNGGNFWAGGHAGVGTPSTATQWILPEGAANGFFDTFIAIANPNFSAAQVTVKFLQGTAVVPVALNVPARSRATIQADTYVSGAFSTEVTSNVGVVAERPMYWTQGNWYGGSVTMGIRP